MDFSQKCVTYKDNLIDKKANVKNSQLSAEPTAHHGLGMAAATHQMRDRVERIMKECEGMSSGHSDSEAENKSDCSAEIKALFTEVYSCYGCEHLNIKSNGVRSYQNL